MPLLTALWSELQGAELWLAYRRPRQCKPARRAGTRVRVCADSSTVILPLLFSIYLDHIIIPFPFSFPSGMHTNIHT